MGNLKYYAGVSAVSPLLWSAEQVYNKYYTTELPMDVEDILFIQEGCENLNQPIGIPGIKHSYLVAVTYTGKKIRYDYFADSIEPKITYNYYDNSEKNIFRQNRAIPGYLVRDVTAKFGKHSKKTQYDAIQHNCQHVVRDSYNELTGRDELLLRNDFVRWFGKTLSEEEKKKFDEELGIREHLGDKFERKVKAMLDAGYTYEEIYNLIKSENIREVRKIIEKVSRGENKR
ncbi:unnamed protein product [Blepharisma stoltei]|uniref:Uncharacterized protein n=1 Tax=Blepharisma stoltei TaxID=1481888 RepID=A0AAU9K6H2_9CILI|nr:unnamed protein product [Blepharisma stoltei]